MATYRLLIHRMNTPNHNHQSNTLLSALTGICISALEYPWVYATGAQVLTRLLHRVFRDIKFEFVYHYLDDVIYGESLDQHLRHVREVLKRLRSAGLTVNADKVVFATQDFIFGPHCVGCGG